jgi:hypothetical protein
MGTHDFKMGDLLDVHMSDFVVVRAFFVKYTSDTHVKIRVDDGLVYVAPVALCALVKRMGDTL